jgi:Na+/melibiose symporter-like transporter
MRGRIEGIAGLQHIRQLQAHIEGQVLFLMTFLLEVAQLDAYHAGVVMAVKQVYDALTDPLIGRWSDMTITRWGRRRPFVFFGAIPFAVTWLFMWYVDLPLPSATLRECWTCPAHTIAGHRTDG